jgi:hypothetical protein
MREFLSAVSRVGVAVAAVTALAGLATAAPVTLNLNYTTTIGTGTAVGTFTIDDSLLAPNSSTSNLSDLISLNLAITGLSTSPSSTIFTKSDLDGWDWNTDAGGVITDVNFFMNVGETNADGYRINGTEPNELSLYDGGSSTAPMIAQFEADPSRAGGGVPTLSVVGLAALVALVAIAALLVLRRGAVAA